MAATFKWTVSTTVGETISVATVLRLGALDQDIFATVDYPIVQPGAGTEYSYEKWVRGSWSGSFSKIDNLQCFMSDSGGGYEAGVDLTWTGQEVVGDFATPTDANSTTAVVTIPVADPGTTNVSIGDALFTGSLTASGYSDYMVFQYEITSTTPPGAMGTRTITLQYDEV